MLVSVYKIVYINVINIYTVKLHNKQHSLHLRKSKKLQQKNKKKHIQYRMQCNAMFSLLIPFVVI